MKTFKEFLTENGFPFAYVQDDEKITIFGHTKKDLVKPEDEPVDKKKEKLAKEENTKQKLNRYIQYAKSLNEGNNNGQ